MKPTHPTPRHTLRKKLSRVIGIALATCALAGVAQAQSSYTWNGGSSTNGNWSDTNNWGGSGPANPQAFLNFNGATRTSSTNNFANGSSGYQIYFKSGANAFTLYGNSITFFDFGGGALIRTSRTRARSRTRRSTSPLPTATTTARFTFST